MIGKSLCFAFRDQTYKIRHKILSCSERMRSAQYQKFETDISRKETASVQCRVLSGQNRTKTMLRFVKDNLLFAQYLTEMWTSFCLVFQSLTCDWPSVVSFPTQTDSYWLDCPLPDKLAQLYNTDASKYRIIQKSEKLSLFF